MGAAAAGVSAEDWCRQSADIRFPFEWIFHQSAIISLENPQPGMVRNISSRLWALPWFRSARILLFVAADAEKTGLSHAAWKAINVTDFRDDIIHDNATDRIAVDATGCRVPRDEVTHFCRIWQPSSHGAGRSTELRNFMRWLLLFLMLALLPACYHMRAEAEPIAPRIVTLPGQPTDAVRKIRSLLENKWKCRILETDSTGTVLITAPYQFHHRYRLRSTGGRTQILHPVTH